MDKYRNQGPEDSEDYHNYETRKIPNYFEDLKALLDKDNKHRLDGRVSDELRKICKLVYLFKTIFLNFGFRFEDWCCEQRERLGVYRSREYQNFSVCVWAPRNS